MGTLNNFDPIFFYLTLGKSATGGAFDGVVTPSVKGVHHTTIINWVKQVGELLPQAYEPDTIA
jgi:hypothetical protein